MALTPKETAELDLRKRQFAARTTPEGKAANGFKSNAAALKQRIAALEAKAGAASR